MNSRSLARSIQTNLLNLGKRFRAEITGIEWCYAMPSLDFVLCKAWQCGLRNVEGHSEEVTNNGALTST